jgi:hypothetical protein
MDVNPMDRRQVQRLLTTIVLGLALSLTASASTRVARRITKCTPVADAKEATVDAKTLEWHSDYAAAHAKAKSERRMLLVNFVPDGDSRMQGQLDKSIETDRSLQRQLRPMVLVRLPQDYESKAADHGGRLVDHSAFAHLSGRTGVAIVDLKHTGTPYYGSVVTALPFSSGKYYRWRNNHFKVALGLPPGTITQRTMVWAVRIHPEAPASTAGRCHKGLAEAAERHSEYQARIGVQGHHRWEQRFHQVRAVTDANGASEVVAESWPDQNMIDSCIDCVSSWRHSPGHWGAVRGRQRLFGYDIRRGRNGIWYGTGIFAN